MLGTRLAKEILNILTKLELNVLYLRQAQKYGLRTNSSKRSQKTSGQRSSLHFLELQIARRVFGPFETFFFILDKKNLIEVYFRP